MDFDTIKIKRSSGKIIGILLAIIAIIIAFNLMRDYFIKKMFASNVPIAVISTAKSTSQIWHPYIFSIGTLVAYYGVDITPEISGMIVKVRDGSDQIVVKGEPLIELDSSLDKQRLKETEAKLTLAKITYNRLQELVKRNAAAQSALDEARAKLNELIAQNDELKIRIAKMTIKAPFSGRIGIRKGDPGEYIKPGDTLASLQMLEPILVNFSLPQQRLKNLYLNQPIFIKVDTYGNEEFKGKITNIDSKVDEKTRNILVQGRIPNKDQRLIPGMFAKVKVLLKQEVNVITVPQTAVTYSLHGNSIYVVKVDGKDKNGKAILKAYIVYVKTGDHRSNEVAILSGLKAGETVVTSGQLKLYNGMRVKINNSVDISKIKSKTQEADDGLY